MDSEFFILMDGVGVGADPAAQMFYRADSGEVTLHSRGGGWEASLPWAMHAEEGTI